jgi:hypothetical protein
MKKESYRQIGIRVAQHFRHQHQLVVLHPHAIARLCLSKNCVREQLVDAVVGLPHGRGKLATVSHVVEQRPDRTIGEPRVVGLVEFVRHVYRAQSLFHKSLQVLLVKLHRRRRRRKTQRPNPQRLAALMYSLEPGHQPTGASRETQLAIFHARLNRQSVRRDNRSSGEFARVVH